MLASGVTTGRNCTFCAAPYEPDAAFLKLVPPEDQEKAQFRRGGGCDQCLDTGFGGRNSVGELLPVNQAFREAVLDKTPTRALQQVAVDSGMKTMWQHGLGRALTGQTTLEEIVRVISVDEL